MNPSSVSSGRTLSGQRIPSFDRCLEKEKPLRGFKVHFLNSHYSLGLAYAVSMLDTVCDEDERGTLPCPSHSCRRGGYCNKTLAMRSSPGRATAMGSWGAGWGEPPASIALAFSSSATLGDYSGAQT